MIAAFAILLLVAAAAAVIVAMTLIRASRNRPAARAASTPCCGACGYSVIGLDTLTCPECGGDLRRVGINSPRSPHGRPLGFAARAILFTVLAGVTLVAACAAFYNSLPIRRTYRNEIDMAGPSSARYGGVLIRAAGASWRADRPAISVTVELRTPGGGLSPPLVVDPDRGGYAYTAADGRRVSARSGLSTDVVLAWMAASGVPTASAPAQAGQDHDSPTTAATAVDQVLREEAALIADEARRAGRSIQPVTGRGGYSGSSSGNTRRLSGPGFKQVNRNEHGYGSPLDWLLAVPLLLWAAAWLWGLRYLWRSG